MRNKVKDINIKKNEHIISVETFHANNIKLDEKSYKNILIYYIGYVTIKKDLKIYSVNRLYLIFKRVNGYITEINGNQYLKLVPIIESQKNK